MTEQPRAAVLLAMVNGYQVSQALHAAVALGLPDLLAGGPRSPSDLATACEADEPTLRRLLRALAGIGVLHEDADGRVSLTDLGTPLRTDAPDWIAGWTRLIGRPYHWSTWTALPPTRCAPARTASGCSTTRTSGRTAPSGPENRDLRRRDDGADDPG